VKANKILRQSLTKLLKKRPVRQCFYLDYQIAKTYEGWLYRLSSTASEDLLLVYQMGKVGSTTLVRSLQAAVPGAHVYHVHALTPTAITRHHRLYQQNFLRGRTIPRHHLESVYLRRLLDTAEATNKYWKVVTLVRDPVARNVSSFFQTLDLYFGVGDKLRSSEPRELVPELQELFRQSYETQRFEFRHDTPLTWLESELEAVFAVDVYRCEFPTHKGYQIFGQGNIQVLLLRLENLNSCAQEAFQEFLGLGDFTLVRGNVGVVKDYRQLYRDFKQSAAIPKWYLRKMYTSRYARHFYTQDEIDRLMLQWSAAQ